MKLLTLATTTFAMILASSAAQADGFECRSSDGLVAKIYNHTNPEIGTRNVATLILSDKNVSFGNKTIAKFTDVNGTIEGRGAYYEANVDHRFNDSNRKGELIGGTKIGFLKTILLDVDFSYADPVADGAYIQGQMTLMKRNGEDVAIDLDCVRYLKD